MKKIILIMALFGALPAIAQPTLYQGQKSDAPYQQLTNGTKLASLPGFAGTYLLKLNKPWMFFGQLTDNDTMLIGNGGFIITTGLRYSMAFDPFLAEMSLKPGSSSGVYLEYDSLSTPQRISVEWRDMKLIGNPGTDVANFRVNLYSNEVVEFHYGNCVSTDTAAFDGDNGPTVIYTLLTRNFNGAIEIHYVKGDPGNPDFTFGSNRGVLNDVPSSGTLYRFEPYTLSQNHFEESQIEIYPNPVDEQLNIEGLASGEIEVFDTGGKSMGIYELTEGKVSLVNLPAGTYIIKVEPESKGDTKLFKIQKL